MTMVVSPTTGSIWELRVAVGDDVSTGDTLIVLESMKMEIPVEAESAGTVVAVHCAVGDAVEEDQPLVEIN
ncbi:MAG: acetyl-CoA carboxylase biotin carboxyl carrier protein subunit [Actinobacteria bacterium]|nr:acetyl-CoA carboxylase biotin carboxyl carrier protein subunit [Actinomycetota bacterium]